MKTSKMLIFCIVLIGFLGCDNNESKDLKKVTVNQYVELLKKGTYNAKDLPEFTYKDIPELLKYRNENQEITNFPINRISSLAMPECSLGMYVLWTIESIRAVAVDSEYLVGRFPSQTPLVTKKGEPFTIGNTQEVQAIISESYYDWWQNNQVKQFDDFKHIDPLANTIYKWH